MRPKRGYSLGRKIKNAKASSVNCAKKAKFFELDNAEKSAQWKARADFWDAYVTRLSTPPTKK